MNYSKIKVIDGTLKDRLVDQVNTCLEEGYILENSHVFSKEGYVYFTFLLGLPKKKTLSGTSKNGLAGIQVVPDNFCDLFRHSMLDFKYNEQRNNQWASYIDVRFLPFNTKLKNFLLSKLRDSKSKTLKNFFNIYTRNEIECSKGFGEGSMEQLEDFMEWQNLEWKLEQKKS